MILLFVQKVFFGKIKPVCLCTCLWVHTWANTWIGSWKSYFLWSVLEVSKAQLVHREQALGFAKSIELTENSVLMKTRRISATCPLHPSCILLKSAHNKFFFHIKSGMCILVALPPGKRRRPHSGSRLWGGFCLGNRYSTGAGLLRWTDLWDSPGQPHAIPCAIMLNSWCSVSEKNDQVAVN